jgi:hypothetical protein
MQSMIARSVKSTTLHDIVEFCVPQRLLSSFTIWAQRGNDGLMRLNVRIDYDEHDRQIELTGDGLPQGVVGSYAIECGASGPGRAHQHGCPSINKAIDLFVKTARDRGLFLNWSASFTGRHDELYKKFHIGSGNSKFRDLTVNAPSTTLTHSEFSELKVLAAVAPETSDGTDFQSANRER